MFDWGIKATQCRKGSLSTNDDRTAGYSYGKKKTSTPMSYHTQNHKAFSGKHGRISSWLRDRQNFLRTHERKTMLFVFIKVWKFLIDTEGKPQTERKLVKQISEKHWYPGYIKNSYNSKIKRIKKKPL